MRSRPRFGPRFGSFKLRTAKRRGAITILAAILLIVMIAAIAFAIDTGYMLTLQTQLDRSVDSAALAGAGKLVEGADSVNDEVVEYLVRNPIGKDATLNDNTSLDSLKQQFLANHGAGLELNLGHWDSDAHVFRENDYLPSALRVSVTYEDLPLFFAKVFGSRDFTIRSEAIATYQPRDIMLVLDLSGSMNYDSDLSAMPKMGRDHVLANIQQMWQELGSPTYGNMGYEPDWVTIPGKAVDASVRWRGTAVDVASSRPLQEVRVYRSSSSYRRYRPAPATTGTYSYSGNLLYKCKVKVDNKWETFDFFKDSHIRRGLGLDNVTYPGKQGSWDNYIDYARNHSSNQSYYDKGVYDAGYRRKFGVLTLITFWNRKKPKAKETPFLWQVSAQPIASVKDSVDLFTEFISQVDANDRVGLAVYNANNGQGELESELTDDYDLIAELARTRQAGHYHIYTNIGGGMKTAREELHKNGREGALKLMVLMTDGIANWYKNGYSVSGGRNYVLSEANTCKQLKIPVLTISLGSGADAALMGTVAERTNGFHFNVPGGSSVEDYRAELKQVFENIANTRPLKLVM